MLFNCVQINMNKAVNALTQLTNKLLDTETIAFITEPYTAYNRICSIPFNFNVFPQNFEKEILEGLCVWYREREQNGSAL